MGFDLLQDLQIEIEGLFGRQPRHVLGKAAIGIAAAQVVMQPGQLEMLLEQVLFRKLPQGFFVMR